MQYFAIIIGFGFCIIIINMQIKEGVIHQFRRPRWITHCKICVIKLNPMFIIYSKCNQPQNTPQRQGGRGVFFFQALGGGGGGGGGII